MAHLSASAVVIHYEEALYQVYAVHLHLYLYSPSSPASILTCTRVMRLALPLEVCNVAN